MVHVHVIDLDRADFFNFSPKELGMSPFTKSHKLSNCLESQHDAFSALRMQMRQNADKDVSKDFPRNAGKT